MCLLLPLTVFLGAVDHDGVHGLLQCVFVYGILGQGAFGKKGSGGFEWWVWYSLLNQQEPCHKSASLELRGLWSWESWERMCWPCCLKDHFICKNSTGRIHRLIITQPPWRWKPIPACWSISDALKTVLQQRWSKPENSSPSSTFSASDSSRAKFSRELGLS